MQLWKLTVAVLGIFCLSTSAQAVQTIIGGGSDSNIATDVKDNTIFQNNVNNSDGGGPGMFSGTNGASSPRRGLIEFNVAGNIPAGSTITSVQLVLFLGQVAGSGGGGGGGGGTSIGLHDVLKAWGEGTAGSGNTSIGGTGQGFAAGTGDATWNASAFPSTLWTNPGGDFAAASSATIAIGTTLNAANTWGSTAAMVADVQSWLDNPSGNFGWELVNTNETSPTTFSAFWTKEAVTADLRPQLIVNYTPAPEPSTVVLLVVGCVAAAASKVRKRFA
ncbi:MAG TPA: DNRLRE domain-containing protein [Pirellulales bacterium]|nr:DNRLRE domain-containing protein [Pirellulales bacterium]